MCISSDVISFIKIRNNSYKPMRVKDFVNNVAFLKPKVKQPQSLIANYKTIEPRSGDHFLMPLSEFLVLLENKPDPFL
jgi:hypothetical protein